MKYVLFAAGVLGGALAGAWPAIAQVQSPGPEAPAAVAAPVPAGAKLKIPEGTEMRIRFNDRLSSATAKAGDEFSISLDDDVTLSDGAVVKAGYRGKGEVTDAEKKGMMGKAGTLNVRLDYVRIGDARVRIRAPKGQQGKGAVGATVVLTVLFGPLGLIKHGHDIDIPAGQTLVAYVDSDALLSMPVAPPPPE